MMKKRGADFLVLGVDGQQGRIAARWLLERGHVVHGVDLINYGVSESLAEHGAWSFDQYDVCDQARLSQTIRKRSPSVVVNCALPHTIVPVAEVCRRTQTHGLDLGTSRPKTRELLDRSQEFRAAGVTYVTSCGSVPGIGSVMVRHAADQFDSVSAIDIGFCWDSKPKVFVCPFAIASVLWEYTRTFKHLQDGGWTEVKPMETAERRDFNFIGSQTVQQVTHPEHYTMPYYFRKKGLETFRFWAGFPDHSDAAIRSLVNLGFHDDRLVSVAGLNLRKDWLLMLMLKDKSAMPENYEEWENLWAVVHGTRSNKEHTIRMECHVPPRPEWREAGCNYDTGLPAAILGEMIRGGEVVKRGAYSMEAPGLIPIKSWFGRLAEEKMTVYQNDVRVN